MLIKTNRNFFDIVTGDYRKAGDEFEVSQERYDELNAKIPGFVTKLNLKKEVINEDEEIEDDTEVPSEDAEDVDTNETEEESDEVKDIDDLTVAELKELLDAEGIEYDSKAKKEELKALLNK